MQQLGLINEKDKYRVGNVRVHHVGGDSSVLRVVRRLYYVAAEQSLALVHIGAVLDRGNAVQQKKVAGQFLITELVLQ